MCLLLDVPPVAVIKNCCWSSLNGNSQPPRPVVPANVDRRLAASAIVLKLIIFSSSKTLLPIQPTNPPFTPPVLCPPFIHYCSLFRLSSHYQHETPCLLRSHLHRCHTTGSNTDETPARERRNHQSGLASRTTGTVNRINIPPPSLRSRLIAPSIALDSLFRPDLRVRLCFDPHRSDRLLSFAPETSAEACIEF